jgi:hypothetical protein
VDQWGKVANRKKKQAENHIVEKFLRFRNMEDFEKWNLGLVNVSIR